MTSSPKRTPETTMLAFSNSAPYPGNRAVDLLYDPSRWINERNDDIYEPLINHRRQHLPAHQAEFVCVDFTSIQSAFDKTAGLERRRRRTYAGSVRILATGYAGH